MRCSPSLQGGAASTSRCWPWPAASCASLIGGLSACRDVIHARRPRATVVAWCLFDWANSAFPAVITTFVFAHLFRAKAWRATRSIGTALWGQATGARRLGHRDPVSPLLGAIADQAGRRKPWLARASRARRRRHRAAVVRDARPGSASCSRWSLVALATIAFELGIVFYNAMLPDRRAAGRYRPRLRLGLGAAAISAASSAWRSLLVVFVPARRRPSASTRDGRACARRRAVGRRCGSRCSRCRCSCWSPDRAAGRPAAAARRCATALATLGDTLQQLPPASQHRCASCSPT